MFPSHKETDIEGYIIATSADWDPSSPDGRTRALLRDDENISVLAPLVLLGAQ